MTNYEYCKPAHDEVNLIARWSPDVVKDLYEEHTKTSDKDKTLLSPSEEAMYSCIDDIDTYSDLAKDNYELFYNLTMKRIHSFHDLGLFESDGYSVWKNLEKLAK